MQGEEEVTDLAINCVPKRDGVIVSNVSDDCCLLLWKQTEHLKMVCQRFHHGFTDWVSDHMQRGGSHMVVLVVNWLSRLAHDWIRKANNEDWRGTWAFWVG